MRPTTTLFIITTFVALAPSMAAPVPSEAKVSPKAAAFVKSSKLTAKVSPMLGRIGVSMPSPFLPRIRSPLSPRVRSAASPVGGTAQVLPKWPTSLGLTGRVGRKQDGLSPLMFKQAKTSRNTVAKRAVGRKAAAPRPVMARTPRKTTSFKSKTSPGGRKVMGAARQATPKRPTTPGSATTPKFKSTYGTGASKTFPGGQKVMGAARQARSKQHAQGPSVMSRLSRLAHAVAPAVGHVAQKASEFMHTAVEHTEEV